MVIFSSQRGDRPACGRNLLLPERRKWVPLDQCHPAISGGRNEMIQGEKGTKGGCRQKKE
jgi:hypothetical protein